MAIQRPPRVMHSAHCSARPRQWGFYYVKLIRVAYQTRPSCGTSSLCARGKKGKGKIKGLDLNVIRMK